MPLGAGESGIKFSKLSNTYKCILCSIYFCGNTSFLHLLSKVKFLAIENEATSH